MGSNIVVNVCLWFTVGYLKAKETKAFKSEMGYAIEVILRGRPSMAKSRTQSPVPDRRKWFDFQIKPS
jgi:hypothetical protein